MKNRIEKTGIKGAVQYTSNGLHRQRYFEADGEEQLLYDVFNFQSKEFTNNNRMEIKTVEYHGKKLRWNDFMAHNHFAKGRITLEEFKSACLTPEKPAL